MNILLTGGTGYIGSHTAAILLELGHQVILLDNLSNSNSNVLAKLKTITGYQIPFVHSDVRDTQTLQDVLKSHDIKAVIHFAGLKAVGESTEQPITYYSNNIQGTISLLQAMQATSIKTLVFSSSATVYGEPHYLPLDEKHPTHATNPYGRSKLHIEEILSDVAQSDPEWRIISLRYFNPVGAHPSGLIGENPQGIPNNLMPYIAQVASRQRSQLNVFGNDYPTPDGTGIRDYIHIMDLASGHAAALDYLKMQSGYIAINLGTGQGYSVLEMVKAYEHACGHEIPYSIAPRRSGDIAICYANPALAYDLLNWQASYTLDAMCASTWKFQQMLHQNNTI